MSRTRRQRRIIKIEQFFWVEGGKSFENAIANPTSANGSNYFTFDVKRIPRDLGNIPIAPFDHFVSRYEVPNEKENIHDNVFCHRRDVGTGNFQNLNFVIHGSVKIDVVRTNPGRDTKLEIFGLQCKC